jgi:hypothetical protein
MLESTYLPARAACMHNDSRVSRPKRFQKHK